MQYRRIRRRTILGCGVAAVTGSLSACRKNARAGSAWRVFTDDEARTVDAICEQLIPADGDPGAHDAGVVNFIDIQLATHLRRHRRAYREGIAKLDATSRARFGRRFTDLSSDQATELLSDLDQNADAFFELILTHTRQGFYGDPRHGGNRDRVSWKMLRLPFPQVRGRQHYDQPDAS
jgi:gluconate 2-dehydrogenase gamma chain